MRKELLRVDNLYSDAGVHELICGNLCIQRRQIMGVMGLRDSGVTELCDILKGEQPFAHGHISFDDKPVGGDGWVRPEELGIVGIHYSSRLNPKLTVADNIFLTNHRRQGFLIRGGANHERTKALLQTASLNITPKQMGQSLTIAQQHLVLLLRAIHEGRTLIILEGIHQNYTKSELNCLGKFLRRMVGQDLSVIIKFYNFEYETMFQYLDQLTMLRGGQTVACFTRDRLVNREMLRSVLGRKPFAIPGESHISQRKREIMYVERLRTTSNRNPVSFSVYEGETVRLVDEEGLRAMEIAGIMAGSDINAFVSGRVYLNGKHLQATGSGDVLQRGVYYIPENAQHTALCLNMTAGENLMLTKVGVMSKRIRTPRKLTNFLSDEFYGSMGVPITPATRRRAVEELDARMRYELIFLRGLLTKVKVFVMIAPFAYNDEVTREFLANKLLELNQMGISVVIADRYMPYLPDSYGRVIQLTE